MNKTPTKTVSSASSAAGEAKGKASEAAGKVSGKANEAAGKVKKSTADLSQLPDPSELLDKIQGKVSSDIDTTSNKVKGDIDVTSNKVKGDVATTQGKVSSDINTTQDKVSSDIDTTGNKVASDIRTVCHRRFCGLCASSLARVFYSCLPFCGPLGRFPQANTSICVRVPLHVTSLGKLGV